MAGSGLQSTFRCGPIEAIIFGSPHYVCPVADELPRMLDAFCAALARATELWAPCNAAALALWSLCYLHLFSDGNGRTARGFAYAVLVRTNVSPLTADRLHLFHAYFRGRAIRRRYFEMLQATTDALSGIADPLAFPEDTFAPLAALIAEATTVAGDAIAVSASG